jgi:rRNA-processing protein FCF1
MNVLSLLQDTDLIYIDTASLMNSNNLRHFLTNYKKDFYESRKMIIVSEAVCQELLRHINSANGDKANKAMHALNIIREYNNIFILEQSDFSPEEIQHAFADQELLVRLTKERRSKRQLLITNDRSLSKDAYDLNMLQSCRGKEISVCYVNYYGFLKSSDIYAEKESVQDTMPPTASTIESPISSEATVSAEITTSPWGYIGVALGAFVFGFGTSRYGKGILNNVKALF